MLNIEFKPKEKEEKDSRDEFYIVVNGIPDKDSYYSEYIYKSAGFYDDEVVEILLAHSFGEIGKHFTQIGFNLERDWWDDWLDFDVYCNKYFEERFPRIRVNLRVETEHWAKPWSLVEFSKALAKTVDTYNNPNISYFQEDEEFVGNGFGVEFLIEDTSSIIKSHIDECVNILKDVIDKTNNYLIANIDKESLTTYFQFPESVKTACNQYLVYFAQFVADIGIEVDTELKQVSNSTTLFKITPLNKEEALTNIKEALSIYLQAPSMNDFEIQTANFNDIAVSQWQANIFHLKSQLAISRTLLQAKDALIENLQLSNYQYRQIVEQKTQIKPADKDEELIKDIVTVKKFDGKGFSVNFPEILRRLKRVFK